MYRDGGLLRRRCKSSSRFRLPLQVRKYATLAARLCHSVYSYCAPHMGTPESEAHLQSCYRQYCKSLRSTSRKWFKLEEGDPHLAELPYPDGGKPDWAQSKVYRDLSWTTMLLYIPYHYLPHLSPIVYCCYPSVGIAYTADYVCVGPVPSSYWAMASAKLAPTAAKYHDVLIHLPC
jgi:hypothetical protein